MIHLVTDFGPSGPYLGQMIAVLRRSAPEVPVVDLLNDAPAFAPELCAHLLAALLDEVPAGDLVMAIVDPGVGTERAALALQVDGRWLVGPDNGLFEIILRRAVRSRAWRIAWRPGRLSASFHGRDLFAPVAARLARGDLTALEPGSVTREPDWPDELDRIVHVDAYGNAVTGRRAASLFEATMIEVAGRHIARARTFGAVPIGTAFWYENSLGLVELAVSRGSAARELGLKPGSRIAVLPPDPVA
jgi:S-adenosyl-L-methionine hydrolase (adenosine-forming)